MMIMNVGSGKQRSVGESWEGHRERRERVLWGQKACFQYGPLRRHLHDRPHHHPLETLNTIITHTHTMCCLPCRLLQHQSASLLLFRYCTVSVWITWSLLTRNHACSFHLNLNIDAFLIILLLIMFHYSFFPSTCCLLSVIIAVHCGVLAIFVYLCFISKLLTF